MVNHFDRQGNFLLTPESFLWLRVGAQDNVPNIGVWSGEIYNVKDNQGYLLSNFVGMCVAIRYLQQGQLMLLVKEVLVWTDADFNPVQKVWDSLQERMVQVVHVRNEPAIRMPVTEGLLQGVTVGSTDTYLDLQVRFALDYPNPIPVRKHPEWSSKGNYQASEYFGFRVYPQEYGKDFPSVPFTWRREATPYPWMLTGPSHDYHQVMEAAGELGPRALDNAPPKLLAAILKVFPNFSFDIHPILKAPQVPCQTTWTNIANILVSQDLC